MTYSPIRKRTRTLCSKAAAKIEEICGGGVDGEMGAVTKRVIAALRGNFTVFQLLDERPSWFFPEGGHGHSTLRSVRNSPTYGPKMFASFRR